LFYYSLSSPTLLLQSLCLFHFSQIERFVFALKDCTLALGILDVWAGSTEYIIYETDIWMGLGKRKLVFTALALGFCFSFVQENDTNWYSTANTGISYLLIISSRSFGGKCFFIATLILEAVIFL
jgi:hypothetical protein